MNSFPQSLRWPEKLPIGLFRFYILDLISKRPLNSLEIYQLLSRGKNLGNWKPSVISISLTLEKLAREGLVGKKSKSPGTLGRYQQIYEITLAGLRFLRDGKNVLANADRNWFAMREIFIELMDATLLPTFLRDGARDNFQLSREIIEAKMPKLNNKDIERALKDYALNLDIQRKWIKEKLKELEKTKYRTR
jgi:DNA-binding PadR family transcriptional regulator